MRQSLPLWGVNKIDLRTALQNGGKYWTSVCVGDCCQNASDGNQSERRRCLYENIRLRKCLRPPKLQRRLQSCLKLSGHSHRAYSKVLQVQRMIIIQAMDFPLHKTNFCTLTSRADSGQTSGLYSTPAFGLFVIDDERRMPQSPCNWSRTHPLCHTLPSPTRGMKGWVRDHMQLPVVSITRHWRGDGRAVITHEKTLRRELPATRAPRAMFPNRPSIPNLQRV